MNYEKILKRLLDERPHEIDKIKKVIEAANDAKQYHARIDFDSIIKSNVWNSDEKATLLHLFGYSKSEHDIKYIDENKTSATMRAYDYTIKYDILSGFEALMKTFKDVKRPMLEDEGSIHDEAYRNIFERIIVFCKEENISQYIKAVTDTLTDSDLKRLIAPCYKGHFVTSIRNKSIMIEIIASKDLDLIKEYIDYVDDINMYLLEAVATGSIEIVQFFLDKGADINYVTDEVILGRLTPLKMAIVNNDYEMAEFLVENGADVNLQVKSNDFIDRLNNYQIDIVDSANGIKQCKEEDVIKLRYIRESSPLEFATKLRDNYECSFNEFLVEFNGGVYSTNNKFKIKANAIDVCPLVINRGKIIDLIFDKIEDKSSINWTDLIIFTFIIRDVNKFKKYIKYVIQHKYKIDFDLIFKSYFDFKLDWEENMLAPVMEFIDTYEDKDNIYLKFFDHYLKSKINIMMRNSFFKINNFGRELLKKVPSEMGKQFCVMPYCRDLKTVKTLVDFGFDIHQVDEKGRNILFKLMIGKYSSSSTVNFDSDLFDYLLEFLDLSIKDKYGRTALYYAISSISTEDENQRTKKDDVGTKNLFESFVVRLIYKMNKEDVYCDDIMQILEGRMKYCSDFGDKIHYELIYQNHEELFSALISKGFVLSDKLLDEIFSELYPSIERMKAWLPERINVEETLDYVYGKLDRNTEIQKLDIEKQYNELMIYIDSSTTSFDKFEKAFKLFYGQITSLKTFYENSIKKKHNPERYLQYAKERYNTIYHDLDKYLLRIMIKALEKYGSETLTDILELAPNYDLNYYVVNDNIGLDYWQYIDMISDVEHHRDENILYEYEHFRADNVCMDYDDMIIFTGGLMQYAILTDNLPMVQLLEEMGASLKLIIGGENHTWDYVNSHTMSDYFEGVVGSKAYSDLDDEEAEFYINLMNSDVQDLSTVVKRKLKKGKIEDQPKRYIKVMR